METTSRFKLPVGPDVEVALQTRAEGAADCRSWMRGTILTPEGQPTNITFLTVIHEDPTEEVIAQYKLAVMFVLGQSRAEYRAAVQAEAISNVFN